MFEKQFPMLLQEKDTNPVVLFGKTLIFLKMKALNFIDFTYNKKIEKMRKTAVRIQKFFYRTKMRTRVRNHFFFIIFA